MINQLNTRKPYIIIAGFILLTAILLAISLWLNHMNFIYVLDDPYIHMAIAKNLVTHGYWAVNGLTFSSATSSPLWSLLISAVYLLSGINVLTPFILNILFSAASIYMAYRMLLSYNALKHIYWVMTVFVLAAPLPALAFTGMEHIAQIFFALFYVYLAAKFITANDTFGKAVPLIIISVVLVSLRYEDLFLVFSVSALLALRKKYTAAALILAGGLLPIILYGFLSTSNGWMFLPNPVLIKSRLGEFTLIEALKLPLRAVKKILEPDILFLVPPILFVLYKNYKIKISKWNDNQVMFFIFLLTYLLHMIFAQTGWFYRYEAYLVSLGIVILWINIYDYLPSAGNASSASGWLRKLKPVLYAVMILSLCIRAGSSFLVPQSANNIYSQHYQISRFVAALPPETVIAANDIGMINYYTPNKIIDLWGLADLDIAKAKLEKKYNTAVIDSLTKQKKVYFAVIYEEWFKQYGGVPAHWQKIGEWKMNDLNIVNGNETVSFYALDSLHPGLFVNKLNEVSGDAVEKHLFYYKGITYIQ